MDLELVSKSSRGRGLLPGDVPAGTSWAKLIPTEATAVFICIITRTLVLARVLKIPRSRYTNTSKTERSLCALVAKYKEQPSFSRKKLNFSPRYTFSSSLLRSPPWPNLFLPPLSLSLYRGLLRRSKDAGHPRKERAEGWPASSASLYCYCLPDSRGNWPALNTAMCR